MKHNKIWLIDDSTMKKLNYIQQKFSFKNKDELLNFMAKVVLAYIDIRERNYTTEFKKGEE